MNPFMLGLTALSGISNPELLASSMAAAGATPDAFSGAFSSPMDFSVFDPAAGGTSVPGTMLAAGSDGGIGNPGASALNPMMAGAALSGLQGVKTPEPVKPIMQGGVYKAQPAPEANPAALHNTNLVQVLNQLVRGAGTPPPTLGSLLGGGR